MGFLVFPKKPKGNQGFRGGPGGSFSAEVSSVAFVDADLSSGLVGGSVTWLAPADTAGLTQYTVVFALDAAGGVVFLLFLSIFLGRRSSWLAFVFFLLFFFLGEGG